jgi:hypothetical protein
MKKKLSKEEVIEIMKKKSISNDEKENLKDFFYELFKDVKPFHPLQPGESLSDLNLKNRFDNLE